MNVCISIVILMIVYLVQIHCGSSFFLTSKDSLKTQLLEHKTEFYKCDREKSCTHVVKILKNGTFRMLLNLGELQAIKGDILVWEKISTERVPKEYKSGLDANTTQGPVVVTTNLALNKPATMISMETPLNKPSNAVDGKLQAMEINCAISKRKPSVPGGVVVVYHWFRVDLEATAVIYSVALQNCNSDSKWQQMQVFDVKIGNSTTADGASNPICVKSGIFGHKNQYVRAKCTNPITGQYIYVYSPGIICLGELEVYGRY